jgi:hypothetical protein
VENVVAFFYVDICVLFLVVLWCFGFVLVLL